MDKKRLFNISLFCGIFLWIIPSGIFYEVDKKIVLFYFGFHLIMSLLYLIQFRNVTKDKRNTQFEWVLIYLSTAGSILVHVITCVSLLFLKGNIYLKWKHLNIYNSNYYTKKNTWKKEIKNIKESEKFMHYSIDSTSSILKSVNIFPASNKTSYTLYFSGYFLSLEYISLSAGRQQLIFIGQVS